MEPPRHRRGGANPASLALAARCAPTPRAWEAAARARAWATLRVPGPPRPPWPPWLLPPPPPRWLGRALSLLNRTTQTGRDGVFEGFFDASTSALRRARAPGRTRVCRRADATCVNAARWDRAAARCREGKSSRATAATKPGFDPGLPQLDALYVNT
eukprot:353679-Chlamydomonas_euryale.AAC.2